MYDVRGKVVGKWRTLRGRATRQERGAGGHESGDPKRGNCKQQASGDRVPGNYAARRGPGGGGLKSWKSGTGGIGTVGGISGPRNVIGRWRLADDNQ
ncbi:hypothetical protein BO71DRAFT_142247 [Aspergillus ellipticus CBS 707.79]|uniref:Uncharacterized protein n=1 Tax=Aspergillus ellipticus CBS 707.79 TaxID=1448320 RepID=A0A319DIP6_9EURO|nr:hypothetical protein BO71DRAFT_142247 [Aspergillus ellipticus CBS 707.79]